MNIAAGTTLSIQDPQGVVRGTGAIAFFRDQDARTCPRSRRNAIFSRAAQGIFPVLRKGCGESRVARDDRETPDRMIEGTPLSHRLSGLGYFSGPQG
jgi:hypothetical protein